MTLELSGNALTSVDENVAFLTMLKELDLSGNTITQVADAIGTLPKLEVSGGL